MPDFPLEQPTRISTPWFPKFAESLFTAVAVLNVWMMLTQLLPREFLLHLGKWYFAFLLLGQLVIGVLFGLLFSFAWHSRERRKAINSGKIRAWMQAILRYWLAFDISIYGFGKIFRTQFGPNFSRSDSVVGQLSGFELTWNYFGHSYPFALLIAGLQIGGSILLLFRRTTLLGAAILLPIMTNILLINVFFHIASGAFLNSILFTLGLAYLLYLRREELIRVFLRPDNPLPAISPGLLKQGARLLAIGGPFAILFMAVNTIPASPLEGKWTVDRLVRNHDTVPADTWQNKSDTWRTVYIERGNQLHFCPNPYFYDKNRSLSAVYFFDSVKHEIRFVYKGANTKNNDTATGSVSRYDGSHLDWDGIMGEDTVRLQLSRVSP